MNRFIGLNIIYWDPSHRCNLLGIVSVDNQRNGKNLSRAKGLRKTVAQILTIVFLAVSNAHL